MNKVVECIILGSIDDVNRYINDIIRPAVVRGDVEDYAGIRDNNLKKVQKKKRRRILEDSSSSEDEQRIINKKKTAGKSKSKEHNTLLIDTDDESVTTSSTKILPGVTANNNMSMSKQDKLNFRVAKKRKAKAENEMEISSIINSKNWDASSAFHNASSQHQSRKKMKNMGDLSDALLYNIEKKYGGRSKKKPPKKRR